MSPPPPAASPNAQPRSCVVCRKRKVRCDKQSPCSNCRRANIACVLPSTDRPPRWARRLERITNNAAAASEAPGVEKVMERLHTLENLVRELTGQLEQARAASGHNSPEMDTSGDSPLNHPMEPQRETALVADAGDMPGQFGRMVLQDTSRSRYVSSSFWVRVNDELDGLKMDTRGLAEEEYDSSEDEATPAQADSSPKLDRTTSEYSAFLFQHNPSGPLPELSDFRPLPSQIPFLVEVFSENVHVFIRVVHLPTIVKMVRDMRGSGMKRLTPSNEALMFSIYFSAINSMEDDDVITNFGSSRTELMLKYRLGFEHALAKADFLNAPDIVRVQAFALFLALAWRHDNPRCIWMMTGLLIRMARYLGLHRDGTHFAHLTPFETHLRRIVWGVVCILDVRASEDQGTELGIPDGSFDTQLPWNINDADIDVASTSIPPERQGFTDMSFARIHLQTNEIHRKLMDTSSAACTLEEKGRLLDDIHHRFDHEYLQHTREPTDADDDIFPWVATMVARITTAKLTLVVYLPVLSSARSSSSSSSPSSLRTKLLFSAIDLAECNHALNASHRARQWRWLYQSYTHWHAIVFLAMETGRRAWSPTVERAWGALHSRWLIPARTAADRSARIWVPVRRLVEKARRHREGEIGRLRAGGGRRSGWRGGRGGV
ncbi:hypothetical protein BDV95DRAFT_210563 [Massariosphaeria phaeospora]|uniref:Zn(2)-C6 fungal-type domain-containing protein n=1 Tax=Massariosphaeria phaeospora TaxID=100035 RepID=A0A7C8M320_9PLEO|nr:hypothetical protein BDV95DRAFT_210563 [Massariosphaeria phaeospora]